MSGAEEETLSLSEFLEMTPLPYQSLDEEGNIIYANKNWLNTLGYSRDEVVGRWFGEFLDSNHIEEFRKRAVRNHPLTIKDKLRNKRISKKRAPGERPFAVIRRVFKAGHVMVTTTARTAVKMTFACFSYNLYHLGSLKKKNLV